MLKRLPGLNILILLLAIVLISCKSGDEKSLEMYKQSLDSQKSKAVDYFFFVGDYGRRAALYKYDLLQNSYKMFWNDINETVIMLLYSDDEQQAFFITAFKIGVDRGVSFIHRIKLYRINITNSSVELVSEIGNAIQLYAEWVEMNFKVQFTQFDLKVASYIDKINQIYSPFGKLMNEDTEVFNFISDGYPKFDIHRYSLISPSGNFGVSQSQDSIYFLGAGNEQGVFIDSAQYRISEIKWSEDESFIFFSDNGINSDGNEQSTLYVYDVINQKVLKKVQGKGRTNFILIKDCLIFDDYSEAKQSINIFNFRENTEVNRIQMPGGCSVKYYTAL
jgi:hypothetical protein